VSERRRRSQPQPQSKPPKRQLPLRITEDLYQRLARRARAEHRSLNNLIEYLLWLEDRRYQAERPDEE
jgi:hypothetical protein